MKTLHHYYHKKLETPNISTFHRILAHLVFMVFFITANLYSGTFAIDREKPEENKLYFKQGEDGSFNFNTGVLEGTLRQSGKSTGLIPVSFTTDSFSFAAGEGLYNHYRVFTLGKRYGYGARRWPSTAMLLSDGSVEVTWPATSERPFVLQALYRWATPTSIDMVTIVKAQKKLDAFEVFLASYFSSSFTDSQVSATINKDEVQKSEFVSAKKELGEWLAFPRDEEAAKVIGDGRWDLEPHPLKWTMMPDFNNPVAFRRDTLTGITVVMMAKRTDCFGIFTPYGEEKHFSTYLSLFGYNIEEGETAVARSRLVFLKNPTEEDIINTANTFLEKMP